MKTEIIHEGMTMEYIPQGFLIMIVAIAGAFIHPLLGLLIATIGIGVFTISTGIEIDHKNLKMRKYKGILMYRWGKWLPLNEWEQAKLILSIDNKDMPAQIVNAIDVVGGARKKSSIRTFDLVVTFKNGTKATINHFLKYSFALKTMQALAKIGELKTMNLIEERLIRQRKTRRH